MVESKILGKIATWLLIILFILIFIFAFYSPEEGFMGKIAKLALSAERFLPIEPSKEVKQDESLPQSTINTQEAFMNDITSYADKEECLLNLRSLSGLGDSRMEVVNFEGRVILRIDKPVGKEGGIKLNPKDTGDKKLQVCTINPEAFYDCYLNTRKKDCTKEFSKPLNSVQLTKDGIIIDKNPYALNQGFLFKPKKDKVCFIPVHSSTGDSWYKIWKIFTTWGCDASKDTIDDDCIQKIQKRIKPCSAAEERILKLSLESTAPPSFNPKGTCGGIIKATIKNTGNVELENDDRVKVFLRCTKVSPAGIRFPDTSLREPSTTSSYINLKPGESKSFEFRTLCAEGEKYKIEVLRYCTDNGQDLRPGNKRLDCDNSDKQDKPESIELKEFECPTK